MGKRILGIVGSYRQLFRTPCSARRVRLDISWLRSNAHAGIAVLDEGIVPGDRMPALMIRFSAILL